MAPILFTAAMLAALSGRTVTDEQAAAIHAWVVTVLEGEIGVLSDPASPGVTGAAVELGVDAVPAPGGAASTASVRSRPPTPPEPRSPTSNGTGCAGPPVRTRHSASTPPNRADGHSTYIRNSRVDGAAEWQDTTVLVNPLPGASRSTVYEVLRQLQIRASNLQAGPVEGGSYRWLVDYLSWVTEAVRMLGSQISTTDINRLVLTKRYELLLSMR